MVFPTASHGSCDVVAQRMALTQASRDSGDHARSVSGASGARTWTPPPASPWGRRSMTKQLSPWGQALQGRRGQARHPYEKLGSGEGHHPYEKMGSGGPVIVFPMKS